MKDENVLPPEAQKFVDTYLHTVAERQLFLKAYRTLASEKERQAFLARYAEVPEGEEDTITPDQARRRMEAILNQRDTSSWAVGPKL